MKTLPRVLFPIVALALFAGVIANASAGTEGHASQVVHKALAGLAPGATISHVGPAPVPGFYQALVQGSMVYVSADGTYVMAGTLYDAPAQRNLTRRRMDTVRRETLAAVPASDYLTYAPAHPKFTVTVFTDIDCGYCRVFHQQMAAYNAEGIAVHYLFWPRSGIKAVPSGRETPSYVKAVSVWCAQDRKKAFDQAKVGATVPVAKCPNPIAREYRLGERIGVDATPTIIAGDGSVVGGYLSPSQLLHALRMTRVSDARDAADSGSSVSSSP
jgi:thiol:disulfide interchange protein DsbC